MNRAFRPPRPADDRPVRANATATRGGFTLLEVVVALAVAGLLLLGARALLEQVGDAAERIAGSAAEVDRDANAERLLRGLVGRAEIPREGEEFAGTARGARFATWCDVPAGWQERCAATVAVLLLDGAPVLAVQAGSDAVVPVRRGARGGHLLYLRDAGGGGAWVGEWKSTVSLPAALGVVLDGDTLLLRVGERG